MLPTQDASGGEETPSARQFIVDEEVAGQRIDSYLAARLGQHSRTQVRKAIHDRLVTVNGQRIKASYHLQVGDQILVAPFESSSVGPQPEDIPLDILYEDDVLVAVNKPAGMVVHPAKGHWSGTLASALAYRFQQLSSVGGLTRPGIVHRLDRDTTGVIVVAKNDQAHLAISDQFAQRSVAKQYLAIVRGTVDRDADIIDQPIGMHPCQRDKMAIRAGHATSRAARTRYELVQRFRGFSALSVTPQTGRTHQIRVHLAHMGHPVVCDRLYAGHRQITRGDLLDGRPDDDVLMTRHALHAQRLCLRHPDSGEPLEFTAPLPPDMQGLLLALGELRLGASRG